MKARMILCAAGADWNAFADWNEEADGEEGTRLCDFVNIDRKCCEWTSRVSGPAQFTTPPSVIDTPGVIFCLINSCPLSGAVSDSVCTTRGCRYL